MTDPDQTRERGIVREQMATSERSLGTVRTRAEMRHARRRRWPLFAAAAIMSAALGVVLLLGMTLGADSPMRGTAGQSLVLVVGGICLLAAAYFSYEASCRLRIPMRRSTRIPTEDARSLSGPPLTARREPGG